jgi:hypothetical protein
VRAGGEARALVEQVGQADAGLDGEDIGERFFRRAAEIEPQAVGQGAQPVAAGKFEERVAGPLVIGWPAAQPGVLAVWDDRVLRISTPFENIQP